MIVYDSLGNGHRQNYVRTLATALGAQGMVGGRLQHLRVLLFGRALVLPTFEGDPWFNTALIATRMLLRRKTVVIMLRAHLVEHRTIVNQAMHNLALRLFARSVKVLPLSIVDSEDLRKRCPGIGFVEDPEFWDLTEGRIEDARSALADEVSRVRQGRSVLIVVGGLSASKGLAYLCEILQQFPAVSERLLVVIAGQVLQDARPDVEALEAAGAFVRDRYLSDDELISLFKLADMAWCCYPEERNMSSGIFGRCLQIGVVPIVRTGSLLDTKFGEKFPVRSIPYEDAKSAAAILCTALPARPTRQLSWTSQSANFRYALERFFGHVSGR